MCVVWTVICSVQHPAEGRNPLCDRPVHATDVLRRQTSEVYPRLVGNQHYPIARSAKPRECVDGAGNPYTVLWTPDVASPVPDHDAVPVDENPWSVHQTSVAGYSATPVTLILS